MYVVSIFHHLYCKILNENFEARKSRDIIYFLKTSILDRAGSYAHSKICMIPLIFITIFQWFALICFTFFSHENTFQWAARVVHNDTYTELLYTRDQDTNTSWERINYKICSTLSFSGYVSDFSVQCSFLNVFAVSSEFWFLVCRDFL